MGAMRGAAVAALLAAVLTGGGVDAGWAQAAPVAAPAERTIRVSGWGEVRARPDEALVQFAVETVGSTARAAAQENARLMQRVVAALVAAGIPRDAVETQNYSISPEYAHDEGRREPRIVGYRARNQVVARTPQLDRVGGLIDTALEAGANRVDHVAFQLRQADAAQAAALREAVERARASAQAIASALGVRLGPVLDATTVAAPYQPMPMMMRARAETMDMAPAPAPTPIEPGQQTIRATVNLVYSIDG